MNAETILMPFVIEDRYSDIIFKKRDSDFGGIIVVVDNMGSVAIDANIPPIFSWPSVIETKLPLSKRNT